MYKRAYAAGFAVFLFISAASAQRAEVTISLNEAFFDSLLDSMFQNFDPPEFSMASDFNRKEGLTQSGIGWGSSFLSPQDSASLRLSGEKPYCNESVKLLREMKGVRTAVKFREGKIYVPLAFSGNYAPPLIGCVEFAGWAEANIDLEFDQNTQKLVGRVRVYNVSLNGTGGLGGSVIAKLIQGSIDKKLNPIEIMSLDKVSFGVPVQSSGTLRMKAQKIKPEVGAGALNVRVEYEFVKG
ncbi:MAG: hypothetical protein ABL999_02020 [Pyrinomonadaceae bacterium]